METEQEKGKKPKKTSRTPAPEEAPQRRRYEATLAAAEQVVVVLRS